LATGTTIFQSSGEQRFLRVNCSRTTTVFINDERTQFANLLRKLEVSNKVKPVLKVVLVQLPIPPLGPEVIRGNVPLAPGYLKQYGFRVGRLSAEVEILPPQLVDQAGDAALVRAIAERQADLIGFSCYVWNVERSLAIARRLRETSRTSVWSSVVRKSPGTTPGCSIMRRSTGQ
jgi:hypothetical protein